MKISAKHLLATAGVAAMMAAPSYAQITIDGNTNFNSTGSPVLGSFDASGSDKLVVFTVGEHGFNNTNGNLNSVTYDGVELSTVLLRLPIESGTDTLYGGISILDNPGASHIAGDIVVDATTRADVWVFGLSGTADGFGNTVIGNTAERSVDILTSAGSLVMTAFNMGGAGNTANVGAVTADAPLTYVGAQESGNNWNGHVLAYENGVSAGTQTYSFTGGNEAGAFISAIEFLADGPSGLPGDTDGDGDVDDSDLGTSFSNYTGPVGATGGKTAAQGDLDGDGDVDDSDLGTSFSNYTGPVGATGGKTAAQGDLDGDGDVDDSDLGTSFSNYTGPIAVSVPEPTSLALLGLGGLLAARRRRA